MSENLEVKVVILGSQGVGKTSLITSYVSKTDGESRGIQPTIGASYFPSKVQANGVTLNLQVWDTAGQERFRSMAPMYYRNADAAILVFDLTDQGSFSEAQFWVNELQRNSEMHICKCLVGNKCDLDCRTIPRDKAERYARMIDAEYFETTIRNDGMEKVFKRIAEDVLSRYNTTPEFKYWGLNESPSSARLSTKDKEDSVKLTAVNPQGKKAEERLLLFLAPVETCHILFL